MSGTTDAHAWLILHVFGLNPYWKASRFLVNPLEMIASIISETYAEAGEDAVFADDEALLMIRDRLLDVDSTIIERTRGTNIMARSLRWLRLEESPPSLTTERHAPACVSSREGSS